MKQINSRVSITNASHEVRVRLQSTTKTHWDTLKTDLEKSTGKSYSDSAFFNWAIEELKRTQAAYLLGGGKTIS
jgi:hypothetical protein